MELVPDDMIPSILERIDAKTLLKFQCVSKLWRSIIRSTYFQQRQLVMQQQQHRQSRVDPDVLLVSVYDESCSIYLRGIETLLTMSLSGSPLVSSLQKKIPTPWDEKVSYDVCKTSCDGLIYLFKFCESPSVVVNPTTQWYRTVPLCNYQLASCKMAERGEALVFPYLSPGFGKDKINGTYKSVWLYNSKDFGLNNNPTICEVFDFVTNSWRYIVSASPYPILRLPRPVYFDGSLDWLTDLSPQCETMVLSLDLHTETFQIISKAPFLHACETKIDICNLDGRLCVSEEKEVNQIIWSFDSVYKTWNQIYSIDFSLTIPLVRRHSLAFLPLGVLGKDKLLLFYDRLTGNSLLTLNPKTKSIDLVYSSKTTYAGYILCYFSSLVSIP